MISLINGQTWLVCGGRDFDDAESFQSAMNQIVASKGCPSRVVHGAARGADALADQWARRMAVEIAAVPADWRAHRKAAGPIRNQRMLAEYWPDLVIAFPGGNGTADMVRRARAAGIEVAEIVKHEASQ